MKSSLVNSLQSAIRNPQSAIRSGGHYRPINVGDNERLISAAGGGALAIYGLNRGGFGGLLMTIAGGALIYRGAIGHSGLYKALSVSTAKRKGLRASVKHGAGIKIEKSVTINKPVEDLFRFWHDFENLPRFLNHLEAVRAVGGSSGKLSHWIARLPAGMKVEWDAEIINEAPNKLIAWRSLDGAPVPNAGSVRFERNMSGQGVNVKVALEYAPPVGKIGSLVAKLLGEDPERRVAEDLRRFKQLMETGRISPAAA
jgi:uncharacterized membrane protein